MSSIRQSVHGVVSSNGGTLSFPSLTTNGNAIVVILMLPSTGAQFQVVPAANVYIVDDSGSNVYDFVGNKQFLATNTFGGSPTPTDIFGQIGQSGPSSGSETLHCAPMRTFTFDHWNSPPLYVWAFEIAYVGSSDAGPPAVFWTGDNSPVSTNSNNASVTQVVPDTGRTAGDGGDVSPKVNLYFAAIAAFTGTVVSVADNLSLGTTWALAPIQNGWGVATAEVIGSVGQQAAFTNSLSTPFAGLWLVIADVKTATPPPGSIVIVKKTVPSGATQAFTFTPSYGSSFTLTDGQSNNSGPLSPGTYSVGESPEPGWSTTTSSDSSAIVVAAGVTTTITFVNTNPNANQQGGGGGIGSGKNIYFDYNINQQCWNLPGILQVPASALGSIETSPGVWRLLISGVLSGVNMLAYRDINNFTDLGLAYQPNAVFGSIQLADPGALAKFGGRGGFVLEYTNAGLAPTLSVLPNDMGATLANEIGSQITGNFVSLSVGSNPLPSPPTLGAQPKSYRSLLYYYLLGKGLSAFVRHLQFQISAPAENAPTELIGFSIFGDEKGEAPAGQLPQVQGR